MVKADVFHALSDNFNKRDATWFSRTLRIFMRGIWLGEPANSSQYQPYDTIFKRLVYEHGWLHTSRTQRKGELREDHEFKFKMNLKKALNLTIA